MILLATDRDITSVVNVTHLYPTIVPFKATYILEDAADSGESLHQDRSLAFTFHGSMDRRCGTTGAKSAHSPDGPQEFCLRSAVASLDNALQMDGLNTSINVDIKNTLGGHADKIKPGAQEPPT